MDVYDLLQPTSQLGLDFWVSDPENDPQDDVEGERIHVVKTVDRCVGPPARDVFTRNGGDHVAVSAQRGAGERGHEQRSHPRVFGFVGHQYRVLAHDKTKDVVAFARVQRPRVGREDLFDVFGAGIDHEVVGIWGHPQGEHVAVLAMYRWQEPFPKPQVQHALQVAG